jgi:hypothetical protein
MRCLLDWLIVSPIHIFSNPNISLRVSEAVEETIHVADAIFATINENSNPTDFANLSHHLNYMKVK